MQNVTFTGTGSDDMTELKGTNDFDEEQFCFWLGTILPCKPLETLGRKKYIGIIR